MRARRKERCYMDKERNKSTFGDFIKKKRKEKGITLRCLASKMGISLTYLHDVETSRRIPPIRHLYEMAQNLCTSEEEKYQLYDLAAAARCEAPVDLVPYIMEHDALRMVLRKARDLHLGEEFWLEIVNFM